MPLLVFCQFSRVVRQTPSVHVKDPDLRKNMTVISGVLRLVRNLPDLSICSACGNARRPRKNVRVEDVVRVPGMDFSCTAQRIVPWHVRWVKPP